MDIAVGKDFSRYADDGVFAVIDGNASRYNTGSHVDVKGMSLLAGISGSKPLAAGALTLAGFVSYGRSSYDTYNSSVKGGGSSDYVGLGLRARLDFAGTDKGHPYAEAHLQGGRVKTDFYSGDLKDGQGRSASYDVSSSYLGAHIGIGYVRYLADGRELDLYAKYIYARHGGDNVRLSTGEPMSFDAIRSRRLRIGGRYTGKSGNFRPYVGLAWEHEFDGRASATVNGHSLYAPDLIGGTGIAEFGFTFTPWENKPFFIDLSIQGYTGKREGFSGSLEFEYRF
jgi:outer membrane autotransporter protein